LHIYIRQETKADHDSVFQLIQSAFKEEEYSDHKEQFLVDRLRASNAYIPSLSLVATHQEKIVGYILLTKIHIDNGTTLFDALALAPVAVLPAFQHKGIGSQLILQSHTIAKDLGFERIILLGHADYYPRFGYQKTSDYNIQLPFDAPPENCMILSLIENGLQDVSGTVVYSKSFLE